MGNLRKGLPPFFDGTQARLDRVLWGMELLADRLGVSIPEFEPTPDKPARPAAKGVVKLREPRRQRR